MEIRQTREGSVNIIELEGRLDAVTSPELEDKVFSLMETGEKDFLFDFSRLDYISSAGLRVLLLAAKKTEPAGGRVVLSSLKEPIQEIFNVSGFSRIFSIYSSRGEAFKNF
jgi:anti-anti-sigma factor